LFSNKGPFVVLTLLSLVSVGILIFREYLFGDTVLLYRDIGSDSLNDYYPCFIHLSDYLRSYGLPSWSFHIGMGQDLYYLIGYLILQPITWLPRGLIAQALVYQHLVKVILAGVVFFSFLRLRRLNPPACLLGTLLLSFSAYMTMGSCWFPLADEVVCFAALLLAIEHALNGGRWLFLSLAVAIVGLLGAFHLYLCALFLSGYVPLRLFGRYGWQPRAILRVGIFLAGASLLGAGMGAIVTLPNFYALLNSPRGSGATSLVAKLSSFPVLGLESTLHYVTAVLRSFANDAVGKADDFRGWGNYLEAPLTYCGLICFLLLPQAFVGVSRRQLVTYASFLAGVLIPTVFPWFRYLLWAFQGDYYRAYSLFCVLGIITISAVAFSRYLENRSLNLWLLFATLVILFGVIYFPIEALQSVINSEVRTTVAILLLSYAVVLAAGQFAKRPDLAAWIVIALAAVELVKFNGITVSNRKSIAKKELVGGVACDAATAAAVQEVNADEQAFFRLTTLRQSSLGTETNLNDAMVLRYYGTSSYTSFNNLNYISFLTAVEAIPPNSEIDTRWAIGLAGNFVPAIFAGEKYTLVEDPKPFQAAPQYELIRHSGKQYLFRNAGFLPFGLTFDRFISLGTFQRLTRAEKEQVLLVVAVLGNEETGRKEGLAPITIPELQKEMAATSFPAIIEKRRATALSLTSFRQSQIEGTVRLEQKSVLVAQTPFDRGWHAFQDGKPAAVLKVDAGLLGIMVDPGEHKVAMRYATPFLAHGLALSLASLLIAGLAIWRWPRLRPGVTACSRQRLAHR